MKHGSISEFALGNQLEEETRLRILAEMAIMDTPAEAEFDNLVQLASHVAGCKTALISLIDGERQWFKAKCGLSVDETPREDAFCAHVILQHELIIVPDARLDERFAKNPLVTGEPNIVFYAGVPLSIKADFGTQGANMNIGTLCVIDNKPQLLSSSQQEALKNLGKLAETLIQRRQSTLKTLSLVDERKVHLRQMELHNRQFRQAERMANIGSWRVTLADKKTQWSDQVYAIHGLPVGQHPSLYAALDFYPGDARGVISNALTTAIETGQPFEVETDFVTAHGELRRVRSMGEVELEDGHAVAVIGVFQDITAQYTLEEHLRRSARMDDLTGLSNRAHFNEFIDSKIENCMQSGQPLAVMLIDLDGFKAVNDYCGHRAGDNVLRLFAKRLKADYLKDCFIARLGGDEFVVVVESTALLTNLKPLLIQLLTDLRTSVSYSDGVVDVTATIGASYLTAASITRNDLMHRADVALYEAKRMNRGSARIDDTEEAIMLTKDEANVSATPPHSPRSVSPARSRSPRRG